MKHWTWIFMVVLALTLSSCATAKVSHSRTILPDNDDNLGGTGIESTDILTVSRKMALSILEVPEIMNANGAPRVALLPIKNNTRFIINKDIFAQKIRIELNKNATGKVRFLARDRIDDILKERQAKRDDLVTASKEGDLAGVDFYLTGELTGLTKAVNSSRSDYVLMFFQLIDAETSDIIWEDSYEIKRVGEAGIAYQ